MKGVASKILIALGIILILAAILWWAIAVNALVKLPDDIDSTTEYEGTFTSYVNLQTGEPLPEGEEVTLDMKVKRIITANAEEFDSSTGIVNEELSITLGPLAQDPVLSAFALDRKTMENVEDDRAWAYTPDNVVNRAGSYYPLLGFDVSKDDNYLIWKGEIEEPVEAAFINEEEKEGVTVYNYGGTIDIADRKEVDPLYIENLDLPSEITFEDIKPMLTAMGVDADALITLATQVLSPEDQQALNQLLQEPIPVNYYWGGEIEVSVEPKTGIPVDSYKDIEALYMEPDLGNLEGIFTILAKYANDPVLGPALAQLQDLQTQLGEMELQKIFEYSYEQTDETVKQAIDDAKESAGLINLVKVYIPWALLIVGALLLIIGLLIGGGSVPEAEE
jgi:hypothetical protein